MMLIRIIATFLLSVLFGYERQRAHKPAGFGTFIFVAVGSCALAITAVTISPDSPLSLIGAIVTGIGFLGAGALIKTTDKIFGFTTAASIWVFAIFGLLMGVGYFTLALVVYAMVWLIIVTDNFLEKKGIGTYQKKIKIHTNKIVNLKDLEQDLFEGIKYKLMSIEVDKKDKEIIALYLLEGPREDISKLTGRILKKDNLESFKYE